MFRHRLRHSRVRRLGIDRSHPGLRWKNYLKVGDVKLVSKSTVPYHCCASSLTLLRNSVPRSYVGGGMFITQTISAEATNCVAETGR